MSDNAKLTTLAREVLDTFEKIATSAEEKKKSFGDEYLIDRIDDERPVTPSATPPEWLRRQQQAQDDYQRQCEEPAVFRFVRQGKIYYVCYAQTTKYLSIFSRVHFLVFR